MNFWTGHTRAGAAPVLVREGFSWGAFFFGPLWLAAHRAWVPAALVLATTILIVALASGLATFVLLLGLAVWLGVTGHDLRRRSLRMRSFALSQIIAARDETEAFGKLLDRRPDLAGSFLPPGAAG